MEKSETKYNTKVSLNNRTYLSIHGHFYLGFNLLVRKLIYI